MSTKVGYLGPDTPKGPDKTSFGYIAAERYFTQHATVTDVEFMNFRSHEAICKAMAEKKLDYGVVAVENVVHGIVAETVRALNDHRGHSTICVCGEITLPIELFYLRAPGSTQPPTKVISHPVALAQCDTFVQSLKQKKIESEARNSTAEAAFEASKNHALATLASSRAEEIYGLERIVPHSVVDNKKSMTRFWILGKEYADKTERDKTAFLVNLKQEQPGNLWQALGCFIAAEEAEGVYRLRGQDQRPNLLLIYPVPIAGRRWEYEFLLEFSGHITDLRIDEGRRILSGSGLSWGPPVFLGSYPDTTTATMASLS